MTDQRFDKLISMVTISGLNGIALNPGPTLTYLTGMSFHFMERPVVFWYVPPADPVIILPELELAKLSVSRFPLKAFAYGDNPATWKNAFRDAARFLGIGKSSIGVEPVRMRVLELRYLEEAAPEARFVSADESLSTLRLQKDEHEIAIIRKAVQIAQQALQNTIPFIQIGASERDLASELSLQLLRAGSDSELPFPPIVSSGPNSANPHASPSARKLAPDDLLVIDWGAAYEGYISDLTRTFAIGPIKPDFKRIYDLVKDANQNGRSAGRPGIPAGAVDRAARQGIETAGFGSYFFHRTGHGIGMEAHEHPYIYAENELVLQPGMVYTVEPGIYLPDQGGVRIEDNIVITPGGCESLSDFNRELVVIE